MINYLWATFFIVGILYSFLTGRVETINNEIIASASNSIDVCLKLIPMMCLWMGLMNIAIDSGLISIVTKKISPVVGKIFPDIPKAHQSLTLISSNIVMNMLGLGNAATPFGLKAMKSLQELNEKKDEATRSMITFLVINTASVTIIPTTVISFRIINGSTNPTEIVLASIITSFCSCVLGLIIDRFFYIIRREK